MTFAKPCRPGSTSHCSRMPRVRCNHATASRPLADKPAQLQNAQRSASSLVELALEKIPSPRSGQSLAGATVFLISVHFGASAHGLERIFESLSKSF